MKETVLGDLFTRNFVMLLDTSRTAPAHSNGMSYAYIPKGHFNAAKLAEMEQTGVGYPSKIEVRKVVTCIEEMHIQLDHLQLTGFTNPNLLAHMIQLKGLEIDWRGETGVVKSVSDQSFINMLFKPGPDLHRPTMVSLKQPSFSITRDGTVSLGVASNSNNVDALNWKHPTTGREITPEHVKCGHEQGIEINLWAHDSKASFFRDEMEEAYFLANCCD